MYLPIKAQEMSKQVLQLLLHHLLCQSHHSIDLREVEGLQPAQFQPLLDRGEVILAGGGLLQRFFVLL